MILWKQSLKVHKKWPSYCRHSAVIFHDNSGLALMELHAEWGGATGQRAHLGQDAICVNYWIIVSNRGVSTPHAFQLDQNLLTKTSDGLADQPKHKLKEPTEVKSSKSSRRIPVKYNNYWKACQRVAHSFTERSFYFSNKWVPSQNLFLKSLKPLVTLRLY